MSMPIQKPGKSKQDYETPPDLIDAVRDRFGDLDFDLAATEENAQAPFWYSEEENSLAQPWAEDMRYGILWLNPPFARIEPWAKKCYEESLKRRGLILLLAPAAIGSNWFRDHVERKAHVLGLSPRVTFVGETAPYPKDLMLCVYGYGLSGFSTWRWKE